MLTHQAAVFRASLLGLATLICCLVACDAASVRTKRGAPPVTFRYRKAQIPGKGLVAGIENASRTETLSNFVVKVYSQDAQRKGSFRVTKQLKPEDSMTVGWVELDGWELEAGDRLSLTCEAYAEAATSTVTAP